jgi:ketosteroid isomerase-like protein
MGHGSFCMLALVWFLWAPVMPASAGQTATPASREEAMIREILDLERHAKEAALHNDAVFTERMLADDYIAIGPLGTLITKRDAVFARRSSQLHYDSIALSEMIVRVYGDTAVVTARAEVRGKNLEQDFSGPYRFTRVWVRRDGQWQTVSYRATVTQ